ISASPADHYRFDHWSGSGSGSYSGSNNPASITMNGPITETAYFVAIVYVTFDVSGMGTDASGTVLTVDGSTYTRADLPKTFTWDSGSSHSYSWSSPVSAGTGKRYVYDDPDPQSDTINPTSDTTITANYKTQYYLTVQSAHGVPSPSSGWFDAGTSITASVNSPVYDGDTRYVCTGWTGTGSVPTSGTGTSVTFTINAPSSITWIWKTQHKLTIQAGSGGTTNPAPGSYWHDEGSIVSVQAIPDTGYHLDYWTLDGSNVGSTNPYPVTMNSPHTLKAYFAINTYTLTVQAYKSGSSTPVSGVTVKIDGDSYTTDSNGRVSKVVTHGTHTVEIVTPYIPYDGAKYLFTEWWDGSTSNPRSFSVTSDKTVTAYMKLQYRLSMQVSPSAGGSTTPSVGDHWYDEGSTVTISASPSASYRFDKWQGSGSGSYSGTNNPASVTMNGPITQTAYFVEVATVTFQVSGMSSDASGTVLTVDGNSYTYANLPVSFTWDVGSSHSYEWTNIVSAGSGKRYKWTSCTGLSTSRSGTITVPSGGGSITATYKTQYELKISINPSEGGSTSPSPGSHWYDSGSSVSVTATANDGYAFDYWSLDGATHTENPITVDMDSPHSLTAYFEDLYTVTVYVKDVELVPFVNAEVTLDSQTKHTDNNGKVVFSVTAGTYTLTVPSTLESAPFLKWTDGETNPSRTITVSGDATYHARYKGILKFVDLKAGWYKVGFGWETQRVHFAQGYVKSVRGDNPVSGASVTVTFHIKVGGSWETMTASDVTDGSGFFKCQD
ncbi:hypothetical protein B6U84_04085, partial [Candidatus Bathyarchaeota archaeon ex4484_40]